MIENRDINYTGDYTYAIFLLYLDYILTIFTLYLHYAFTILKILKVIPNYITEKEQET